MKGTTLDREYRAMLRRDLGDYLLKIGPLTKEEKKELLEWVAYGHSVYENSYTLYDDSGCPMDFINGLRIGNEMRDHPEAFIGSDTAANADCADADGTIPF
jgi:hypothetical protein